MRKYAASAAVIATLLFVGAGCATTGSVKTGADSGAAMKSDNGAAIDVQVDGILKSSDTEKADDASIGQDAVDATSDSAQLDSVTKTDYATK